jgi:Cd2+/Zn2+-exporting ATPase
MSFCDDCSMPTAHRLCVQSIGARPRKVLMVGDGINDSVALAAADVGVAMGQGGSAMAVTAAGVVLMSENLQLIPCAVKLCRVARAVMIQNCVFAIAIKIVAIALAFQGETRRCASVNTC